MNLKHKLQAFVWEHPHYFLYHCGEKVPILNIVCELYKTEDPYGVFDEIEGSPQCVWTALP